MSVSIMRIDVSLYVTISEALYHNFVLMRLMARGDFMKLTGRGRLGSYEPSDSFHCSDSFFLLQIELVMDIST
jgi:hypothetical protein